MHSVLISHFSLCPWVVAAVKLDSSCLHGVGGFRLKIRALTFVLHGFCINFHATRSPRRFPIIMFSDYRAENFTKPPQPHRTCVVDGFFQRTLFMTAFKFFVHMFEVRNICIHLSPKCTLANSLRLTFAGASTEREQILGAESLPFRN